MNKKIYDTVLKAQLALIEKVKPGVQACELDLATRKIIKKAGSDKYFSHRLNHAI